MWDILNNYIFIMDAIDNIKLIRAYVWIRDKLLTRSSMITWHFIKFWKRLTALYILKLAILLGLLFVISSRWFGRKCIQVVNSKSEFWRFRLLILFFIKVLWFFFEFFQYWRRWFKPFVRSFVFMLLLFWSN